MASEIFGPYHSTEEAIKEVNILGLKGYKDDNIIVFTNGSNTNALENRTDVNVENDVTEKAHEDSFMDKVKKIFTDEHDSSPDIHEKLVNQGVSDMQADKYAKDIESGKILILVNDEIRMGNDATDDTVTMVEPVIRRDE